VSSSAASEPEIAASQKPQIGLSAAYNYVYKDMQREIWEENAEISDQAFLQGGALQRLGG
jgi:hypothetical protein